MVILVLLLNIVFKDTVRVVTKGKEIKGSQTGLKLFLFTGVMLSYINNTTNGMNYKMN